MLKLSNFGVVKEKDYHAYYNDVSPVSLTDTSCDYSAHLCYRLSCRVCLLPNGKLLKSFCVRIIQNTVMCKLVR